MRTSLSPTNPRRTNRLLAEPTALLQIPGLGSRLSHACSKPPRCRRQPADLPRANHVDESSSTPHFILSARGSQRAALLDRRRRTPGYGAVPIALICHPGNKIFAAGAFPDSGAHMAIAIPPRQQTRGGSVRRRVVRDFTAAALPAKADKVGQSAGRGSQRGRLGIMSGCFSRDNMPCP